VSAVRAEKGKEKVTNEQFQKASHAQLCGGAMAHGLVRRWKKITKVFVEIGGEMMSFQLGSYYNGRTAVMALGEDGAPYAKLTVNLDDYDLGDDEMFVREDHTDLQLARALQRAQLLSPTSRIVSAGRVEKYARVWRLQG
jgi:hypothetical protein